LWFEARLSRKNPSLKRVGGMTQVKPQYRKKKKKKKASKRNIKDKLGKT
jgi:hypothetical protein